MNARQEAKLSMIHIVQAFGNQYPFIIQSNAAFYKQFNLYNIKVADIFEIASAGSEAITGITADKSVVRSLLCQKAFDTGSLVYAFAFNNNNNTLKELCNYSLTALKRLTDNELVAVCIGISKAAQDNLAALEPYGVTTLALADFIQSIDYYEDALPKPRTAQSLKSMYADKLKALFKETDTILKNQLDKLVVSFRESYPDFVAGYKKARAIVSPPATTTQIKGLVLNNADNMPVYNAKIVMEGDTIAVGFSSIMGKFGFKPVIHGNYTITVTAAGFKDVVLNELNVKMGKITRVRVGLEREA